MATAYRDVLTADELTAIAALPEVIAAREGSVSYFSARLPATIMATLQERLGIDVIDVPMRWMTGDTPSHVDRGAHAFERTTLMYITGSPGELRVGNSSYPITAGSAYTFPEGVHHETVHTGSEPRLLLGPMSERFSPVGAFAAITYYPTEADALATTNSIAAGTFVVGTIFFGSIGDITSWQIATNSTGIYDPNATYANGVTLVSGDFNSYNLYPAIDDACGPRVTASPESQLSTSQRTSLLGAAILYGEVRANEAAGKVIHFKSAAEYTAYKKAQAIASSKPDARPVQSTLVTQLRKFCNF